MTDIFTLQKNPYNIRNIRLFGSENPLSLRFGVDVNSVFHQSVVAKSTHSKKWFFIDRNFQSKNSYGVATIKTINLNDCNIFFLLILVDFY